MWYDATSGRRFLEGERQPVKAKNGFASPGEQTKSSGLAVELGVAIPKSLPTERCLEVHSRSRPGKQVPPTAGPLVKGGWAAIRRERACPRIASLSTEGGQGLRTDHAAAMKAAPITKNPGTTKRRAYRVCNTSASHIPGSRHSLHPASFGARDRRLDEGHRRFEPMSEHRV